MYLSGKAPRRQHPRIIRRDSNPLAGPGLLRRTHGGAANAASNIQNIACAMRAAQMREDKQRITEAIAVTTPEHSSLFRCPLPSRCGEG